jgi:hypothetical protein
MVDWLATAFVNGTRYLVASLLFGVLGFIVSPLGADGDLSNPERLEAGFNWAFAFGILYALNLALLLLLRSKYDGLFLRFVALPAAGMQIGSRLVNRLHMMGALIGLVLFTISFCAMGVLLLMRVAASAADPILCFLRRAKILKWLPEDYPLFSWSFYFLVPRQGQ